MSVSWTISHGGSFKTFESLRLADLSKSLLSLSQDVVTFSAPGAAFDSAALWAYGDSVTIKRDAAVWFVGRVIQVPREGSPSTEDLLYKLAGPWWYLDNLVFQQQWRLWDSGEEALSDQYCGRVVLGQDKDGNRIKTAAQLTEILQWAIAAGAPFQIGTIGPDVDYPWDQQKDILCAEAIRRVLRWTPDSVTWFDYSTTPPTFHCKRRSVASGAGALAAVALNVNQGAPNERINIASRDDLKVPAVLIQYEQTHDNNGSSVRTTTIDKYPPSATGREFGALVFLVELAGSGNIKESQTVEVLPLPLYITSAVEDNRNSPECLAWWKERLPWLSRPEIKDVFIDLAGRSEEETAHDYPNELTKGTARSWMHPSQVKAGAGWEAPYTEKDAIWAYISYTQEKVDNYGKVVSKVLKRYVVYKLVATALNWKLAAPNYNASQTYSRTSAADSGEAVPVGLAQAFYDAVNLLQFEGQFTLVEDEVTGSVGMGSVLNLSGGLAAWENMRAMIYGIDEDVDQGRTTIKFGPQRHLGPVDLIEYLRANRGRAGASHWKARDSGSDFDAGSSIEEDGFTPDSLAEEGEGEATEINLRDPAGTALALRKGGRSKEGPLLGGPADFQRRITLRPSDISKADADVEMKAREVPMFETDGLSWKMRQVLCSASYGDAIKALSEITVITALRYDATSQQIQIKTRTVKVVDPSAETAWTLIAGGQAVICP